MKLLVFADTRTSIELPKVEPELILLLGDIPSRLISKIDRTYTCRKLGVLGNHCHPKNFAETDVFNMHNQIITIDGITFAGFEGSPVYKERKFGQHTAAEAKEFVQKIGQQHIDILLTHSNPAYGDMDHDDTHRGFKAFNDLIFSNQVTTLFHGHLHDPFTRQVEQCTIHSIFQSAWFPDFNVKGGN